MTYLKKIRNYLKGKKSYLLATAAILTALVAWAEGGLSATELIVALYAALQTMFIRAGVSKTAKDTANAVWTPDVIYPDEK